MAARDKFSPGPWSIRDGNDIVDGNDYPVASVDVLHGVTERSIANAELIAECPKLLAALRNFMGWLDTPLGRMKFKDDAFYCEAIEQGREALKSHGLVGVQNERSRGKRAVHHHLQELPE